MRVVISVGTSWSASASFSRSAYSSASSLATSIRSSKLGLSAFAFSMAMYSLRKLCAIISICVLRSAPLYGILLCYPMINSLIVTAFAVGLAARRRP